MGLFKQGPGKSAKDAAPLFRSDGLAGLGGREVSVRHLTKVFRTRSETHILAVADLNLTIPAGSLVTVLGPSGCGKTTVLRMIAGFERPTAGTISIGDEVINDLPPEKRGLGMVFENHALFPHMTVFENVAYALRHRGIASLETKRRVWAMMELTHLEGYERRLPGQLSEGQKQRVALARALVAEPLILLLDEPLSSLDTRLRLEMREEFKKLHQRLGMTSIFVTHDQDEALSLSDLVVVMNQGRAVQIGSPRDVYYRPSSEFVANFLGRANFIEAEVIGSAAGGLLIRALGEVLSLPGAYDCASGERVTMVVRPETVTLNRGAGLFNATVQRCTFLGACYEYEAQVAGQQILANCRAIPYMPPLAPGESARLDFDARSVHLLNKK